MTVLRELAIIAAIIGTLLTAAYSCGYLFRIDCDAVHTAAHYNCRQQ